MNFEVYITTDSLLKNKKKINKKRELKIKSTFA